MNVLISNNQLHNIQTPTDTRNVVRAEPDPFHIEWVTILNATIKDLEHAWACEYATSTRPMRVLVSAGVEDLKQGRSATDLIEDFMQQTVEKQNGRSEFAIATLFNPPDITWFPDNGNQPRGHKNLLPVIKEVNSWINLKDIATYANHMLSMKT